jgi:hypothetical protein
MRVRPTPPGARNEPPPIDDATGWITGAIPDGMFSGPPEVVIDRDEIIIWGRLSAPELAAASTAADRAAAETGRINQHREDTRDHRIRIAQQVEHRYRRKVSWGARCGDSAELFTHLSAPVMTRLRQAERLTLDTLVDAGVARSRSDALAWCVRLVGEHTEEWLSDLRTAMASVDELRRRGPAA